MTTMKYLAILFLIATILVDIRWSVVKADPNCADARNFVMNKNSEAYIIKCEHDDYNIFRVYIQNIRGHYTLTVVKDNSKWSIKSVEPTATNSDD